MIDVLDDRSLLAEFGVYDELSPGFLSYEALVLFRSLQIDLLLELTQRSESVGTQKMGAWAAERERGILNYAKGRKLNLSPRDWREAAIFEAAMEHKLITAPKRGRRKADREGPDIAFRGLSPSEILFKVELVKEHYLRRVGRPETDQEAAKALVEIHYVHPARRRPDDETKIERQIASLVQLITSARSKTGQLQNNHYKKPINK